MPFFRLGLIIWCLYLTPSAFGQLTARNPVDELKDHVTQALIDAKVPLTPDQERAFALLIEEERQGAENLFGETWDFSRGPPQGEQRDQALAGIRWMYDELNDKLPAYLTEAQRAAWNSYQSQNDLEFYVEENSADDERSQGERIQQIRVTNNAFNVETATANGSRGLHGGGAKTEVIERGGVGAFHGSFASTFQDEKFNARNPFASNKPPYYERTLDGNISGPIIQDRLTLNFTVSDNKQENVGTVQAETLTGPFSLGITRPTLNRSYDLKNVLQLADTHSMNLGLRYTTRDSKNENVGDFALPERASRTQTQDYEVDFREIWILSERTAHDIRFKWRRDHSETNPFSNAPTIIVKDAFTGGGAQNKRRVEGNEYELSNLIYFAGDNLTMRAGFQMLHRRERLFSEENFYGEFTFSDLASYRDGRPLQYRVTCCDPLFKLNRTQVSVFSQNDFRLSNTFTLMLGLRYVGQTVVRDRGNVDPRIGFAYAIGNETVVRGGFGIFSQMVSFNTIANNRLDGKSVYEIQIDNPGWPDPFASGSVRPRSRRQVDPDVQIAYYPIGQLSVERSLPNNLFVTLGYEGVRAIKPLRTRDINSPLPETGIRPNPNEGQVLQFQSSGLSTYHHLKASMRQRFSIFVVNANYRYMHGLSDQEDRRGTNLYLPVDSYNLHNEWGNTVDPRHTFSASVNARLPLDVYLTTVIEARSGSFYTIRTGKDDNGNGVSNDRPPGVAKNSEVGPNYFDVGFNFSKAFDLNRSAASTGPQMNVFANLSNAFNMQHPGLPSGVVTSPFFMRSFNATSPRTIEVGMRFQF
jgi:hypothetical protein